MILLPAAVPLLLLLLALLLALLLVVVVVLGELRALSSTPSKPSPLHGPAS